MSLRPHGSHLILGALLLGLAPALATAGDPPAPAVQPPSTVAIGAGTAAPAEAVPANAAVPDVASADATPTVAPAIESGVAAPAAVSAGDVAGLVATLGNALHAGQLDAAGAQLARLEATLPPRSLTLLRMQAWYAHASGDAAGAIALYRAIVARLPADATAAINLAILEAGNGQAESARRRLRRLRALDNGSRIEHAINQVEAQLR